MNKELAKQIVLHIFYSFSIVKSDFINSLSLINKDFLLKERLSFTENVNNKIFGIELNIEKQPIKVLLGDCSIDDKEYCLLVSLKDAPFYAIYFSSYSDYYRISYSIDGLNWADCNTYLQATFLAGMEQIKDLGLKWNKCSDYDLLIKYMKSFINYSNEGEDEGQEN